VEPGEILFIEFEDANIVHGKSVEITLTLKFSAKYHFRTVSDFNVISLSFVPETHE